MKFTLSWLKEHLETSATVDEISDALTDLGLEVEGIEDRAARLSAFTLARVKHAEQHPDADRLRVCTVETNEGDKQIVCGAPNARAGITVVLAKPGDYVPGIDVTLSVGKIRGVESHGMMASERELELSDEHDGIIELSSGAVGQRFVDWLAENDPAKVDPVIEIAITPNRPDALGVRGIARDLAARGLGQLKSRDCDPVKGSFPSPITVTIDDDARSDCPVFCGRYIRGVKNGPSPQWLQDRLTAIGLRPISFLVDVTNFFTYDRNRPLHVFDADKVHGNLRVHRAIGHESMTALDEKTYSFQAGMILISDDNGPESIGGIMGGHQSGVTDDTVNVFLEAAYFDPVRTALTGRALKINSDARYRFERGIDPAWTPRGIEHATRMIMDHAGGDVSDLLIAGDIPDTSRAYRFDPAHVVSLVGMEIGVDEQVKSLEALGFTPDGDKVWVPSWRPDVMGDADIVEEVARIASLTKLKGAPLPRLTQGVPKPILSPPQRREQTARRTIAQLGYNECVTYSFINKAAAGVFGGGKDASMLANPISADMSHMRPSLLPGLLQAAARNQARGFSDLALFEVGHVFDGGEPGEQSLMAAGLLVGMAGPRDVHGRQRPVDVFDAKSDAEAVLAAIGAPSKAQIMRNGDVTWHPGRHGQICLGPKKILGTFGEVHPKVLSAFDVQGPAVAFVILPDAIPMPRKSGASRGALEMSDFQTVDRDFAFIVDAKVASSDIVNAAKGADKKLIASVMVFDEFFGGSLDDNEKSIAITVHLQPTASTLTEKDIEAVTAKIVSKVIKSTGGRLRG